jgi:putative redox protein
MANEQGQAVELGADELLLASLGACTSNTLQNLADQRGWLLDAVDVDLRLLRHGGKTSIERVVAIAGDIDDQQREEFLEAAERTPLTILLKSGMSIKTEPA